MVSLFALIDTGSLKEFWSILRIYFCVKLLCFLRYL